MKQAVAFLVLLGAVLLTGCQVSTQGEATAEPRRGAATAKQGELEPCSLIAPDQLGLLGVESGTPVAEEPLPDASFCRWRASDTGGASYMGGVLPSSYLLADVKQNYGSSRRTVVAGYPAVIAPVFESLAEDTCIVFVELPDKRLVDVSFWADCEGGLTGPEVVGWC